MTDMPRGLPHNWLIGGFRPHELVVFAAHHHPEGISKIPKELVIKYSEPKKLKFTKIVP